MVGTQKQIRAGAGASETQRTGRVNGPAQAGTGAFSLAKKPGPDRLEPSGEVKSPTDAKGGKAKKPVVTDKNRNKMIAEKCQEIRGAIERLVLELEVIREEDETYFRTSMDALKGKGVKIGPNGMDVIDRTLLERNEKGELLRTEDGSCILKYSPKAEAELKKLYEHVRAEREGPHEKEIERLHSMLNALMLSNTDWFGPTPLAGYFAKKAGMGNY